jgi:hypothetical protein
MNRIYRMDFVFGRPDGLMEELVGFD